MIVASHIADKLPDLKFYEKGNPELYEIIYNLMKKQVVAHYNTSFNLHGYPIVSTPKDAIHVFENSDLDILILTILLLK